MNAPLAPILSPPLIHWTENGAAHSARWRSEAGAAPPKRVVVADDSMTADVAYRIACEGSAILWRGDFQNARQLVQALARRVDKSALKGPKSGTKNAAKNASPKTVSITDAFHRHRLAQGQRARTLGMLLIAFDADHGIALRRAPDVRAACREAFGAADQPYVASLRELLGLIGAHEWRRKGVEIAALNERIHPHYGVFSPVRGEYVDLVAAAPLPATELAFDIGTGTGVLAALLAQRGVQRVVATDSDARALACARDNLKRLGMTQRVEVAEADLFPATPARAPLIVCNPPWLPGRPNSPLERAIYDLDSRMLRGFLDGLAARLTPGGEGWLILSDLAEHLGLRTRDALLAWIESAGLRVIDRLDARPRHPKAFDAADPLHAARSAEVTSLWRLAAR